jgi:hypothetical protein
VVGTNTIRSRSSESRDSNSPCLRTTSHMGFAADAKSDNSARGEPLARRILRRRVPQLSVL